jgi:hypothetical protein
MDGSSFAGGPAIYNVPGYLYRPFLSLDFIGKTFLRISVQTQSMSQHSKMSHLLFAPIPAYGEDHTPIAQHLLIISVWEQAISALRVLWQSDSPSRGTL